MIVGPRYNDVDPAVEAAYEHAAEAEAEAETCGHPEGCCEHLGSDEHGCWDCRNTGHTHETEETTPMTTSKLDAIAARLEAATPGPWRTGASGIVAVAGVEYLAMSVRRDADADLIAHAPADLAVMLEFARAVEAAEAKWRTVGPRGGLFDDVRFRTEVLAARRALTEGETDGR